VEGLGLELRVVVVVYLSTACVTLPVLGARNASPEYLALIKWVLAESAEVE
jgi:hypothetical protein